MAGCPWWVLLVITLRWLFDAMDQRLFVLRRSRKSGMRAPPRYRTAGIRSKVNG